MNHYLPEYVTRRVESVGYVLEPANDVLSCFTVRGVADTVGRRSVVGVIWGERQADGSRVWKASERYLEPLLRRPVMTAEQFNQTKRSDVEK